VRRVDDEKLIEMLQDGTQQKAIARHFGVSPQYINKRIKQLRSYQEPESFSKLTEKKKKFVLAKAEGKSNVEAVKCAYDVTSNESAKAMGTALMKDPDVNVAISDLLHQEGIGRRRRIQRLRAMIECPDLSIVGKGLDIANRLTGEYKTDDQDAHMSYVQNIVAIIKEIQLRGWDEEKEMIEDKPDD